MRYRDRKGNTYIVDDSGDGFLKFLYATAPGRLVLKVLKSRFVSKVAGLLMDTGASTLLIDRFIVNNNIRLRDYVPMKYSSFNEFFARKIRKSRRPICKDEGALISPCDGKLSVYRIGEGQTVRVKNRRYTLEKLFDDDKAASAFENGYVYVFRLTVDNYHRYCNIDDAEIVSNKFIKGFLHTVKPVALEHTHVFHENCRELTVFEGKNLGRFACCEVGAMLVGKIVNHKHEGSVKKGSEKGYFEFGGSTIILATTDKIVPDNDLLFNTLQGVETLVKMGEKIGTAKKCD